MLESVEFGCLVSSPLLHCTTINFEFLMYVHILMVLSGIRHWEHKSEIRFGMRPIVHLNANIIPIINCFVHTCHDLPLSTSIQAENR